MNIERVHLYIQGRVQGVGFRYATLRAATSMGVVGWVRNVPDGRVEIEAEAAPEVIADFLRWCQHGPAASQVEDVHVVSRAPQTTLSVETFEIR